MFRFSAAAAAAVAVLSCCTELLAVACHSRNTQSWWWTAGEVSCQAEEGVVCSSYVGITLFPREKKKSKDLAGEDLSSSSSLIYLHQVVFLV